ncbi:hypothetical protein M3O96_11470 [Aquiflexum sp. TKW24L]|jgi:hypothetical protein|uniref:hypothetical protein n=1 Tax=Aquiflexum sp. TKW24L TaxID=2942212 RepID=UPI0020BF8286|nr:hypothetical protein [Aquiflexum sp. TKW24L]MCL6259714.1 hypothetical protein [Aquiflexum sp. TKW24L]
MSHVSVMAQCAMCRAGIENNVSNGETTIGAGLNMGILYLLSMPYLLALVLGYLWYRNAKKRKAKFLFHGEKY